MYTYVLYKLIRTHADNMHSTKFTRPFKSVQPRNTGRPHANIIPHPAGYVAVDTPIGIINTDITKLYTMSTIQFNGKEYDECLYTLPLNKIHYTKVWIHNRWVDDMKVDEIIESIKTNKHTFQPLVGAIMTYGDRLVINIFEGGHRLTAYQKLQSVGELSKYIKTDSIVIQACIDPPIQLIRQKFEYINKFVPVTELYTRANLGDPDENDDIKNNINEVSKLFGKLYSKNAKTSNNPHRPNYNKYIFEGDLHKCVLDDDSGVMLRLLCEPERVIQMFEIMNEIIKHNDDYRDSIRIKAENAGCYIFVYGQSDWVNCIQNYTDFV